MSARIRRVQIRLVLMYWQIPIFHSLPRHYLKWNIFALLSEVPYCFMNSNSGVLWELAFDSYLPRGRRLAPTCIICVRSSREHCTPLRRSERSSQRWQLCYLRRGRSVPPDCKSARRSVLLSWYFINLHQTRRHCHGWQRGQSRVLLSSQLR